MGTITVCITAHPARLRNGKLERAIRSALNQTRQPDALIVGNDIDGRGAGWNRQRILDMVDTDWIAWLDSDDELLPEHLRKLEQAAEATGAVFVFSWMEGHDPLGHFGLPFNPATPHHTTTTYLVRTDLARRVGYRTDLPERSPSTQCSNEDWHHLLGLCKIAVEEDLLMLHLAERTWRYHVDGANTSGLPWQGDAR